MKNEIKFLHCHYLFKHSNDKNEEGDHRRDALIFKPILLTSSIRYVWRKLRRIGILISGLKGFKIETVWHPFG